LTIGGVSMSRTHLFRDWLFDLLVDFFVHSGWKIVIKDFRNSKDRKRKNYFGLTEYGRKVIYLDKNHSTPRILIHELCHFAFEDLLDKISKVQPRCVIRELKGKTYRRKRGEWIEIRVLEFEKLFFGSLTQYQIKTLRGIIRLAKRESKK